jgi:hypothetical protein
LPDLQVLRVSDQGAGPAVRGLGRHQVRPEPPRAAQDPLHPDGLL